MTNLTVVLPDPLARSLERIAAAQQKTVEQLAVEQLRSLVEGDNNLRVGSPAAVLRAMQEPPHLSAKDVGEPDAAIAAGRLVVRPRDPFSV